MERKIYDLKNQRAAHLETARTALDKGDMAAYQAAFNDAKKLGDEIESLQDLAAEQGRFADDDPGMVTRADALSARKEAGARMAALDAARSGNEYANAWASALKNGMNPKNARGQEAYNPLFNALTVTGGSPEGADGGFLVPVDFDGLVHEKMKDFVRLADCFTVEEVSGSTGWRALETAKASKALPLIDEAASITPDDQPSFTKVAYTIQKYGDIIPVSNELMEDNTAGLMAYLARWFAPKVVLTENTLLLGLLKGLAAKNILPGEEVKGIKQALNKGLNTAHSRRAVLLTNQDGYSHLDELADQNGRGLLAPILPSRTPTGSRAGPSPSWTTTCCQPGQWGPPGRPKGTTTPCTSATSRALAPCSAARLWSSPPPTWGARPGGPTPPRCGALSGWTPRRPMARPPCCGKSSSRLRRRGGMTMTPCITVEELMDYLGAEEESRPQVESIRASALGSLKDATGVDWSDGSRDAAVANTAIRTAAWLEFYALRGGAANEEFLRRHLTAAIKKLEAMADGAEKPN